MYNKILIIFILISVAGKAQVGFNTTTPNAKLDIVSASQGILVPRVALSNRLVMAPIVSADEAELIFNTHTTTDPEGLAENEKVTTGFYFWDNLKWNRLGDDINTGVYAFEYETEGYEIRPNRTNGNSVGEWQVLRWDDGSGGGTNKIQFVAPSTGVYQIIFAGNYGLGNANNSGHEYDISVGEGIFRINIFVNGTFVENVDKAVTSFSVYSKADLKYYYDLPKHTTIIKNIHLNAGDVCRLRVRFDEIMLQNPQNDVNGNSWVGDNVNSEYNNKIQVQLIGK